MCHSLGGLVGRKVGSCLLRAFVICNFLGPSELKAYIGYDTIAKRRFPGNQTWPVWPFVPQHTTQWHDQSRLEWIPRGRGGNGCGCKTGNSRSAKIIQPSVRPGSKGFLEPQTNPTFSVPRRRRQNAYRQNKPICRSLRYHTEYLPLLTGDL